MASEWLLARAGFRWILSKNEELFPIQNLVICPCDMGGRNLTVKY